MAAFGRFATFAVMLIWPFERPLSGKAAGLTI